MNRGSAFVESLVGSRVAGRYVVERLLGVGGMGVVAAGRYPELGQKVAIKFLRPEFTDDRVVKERFLREARVAAKVKSAHFVRVYDVGQLESGPPYLVMEMLSGRDLADELRVRGSFSIEDAVDTILQACAGLAELHALGVVHRDLKPSNLFVTEGARTLKVLDFGISKETLSSSRGPLTATDNVLGTPQYMSPEQIKASKDVDARSDVWALGVILYELVTQQLPFVAEGGGVGELFARILYFDPEPPSSHAPDLPVGFEPVIMKCLANDRDQRHESVAALAEALRPFASPRSLHRIEVVKETLATPHPEVGASAAPPAGGVPAEVEISRAATVQAQGATRVLSSEPAVSVRVGDESIHASSMELAEPRGRPPARAALAIAGSAVFVGAIGFVVASRWGQEPASAEPSAPSAVLGSVAAPSSSVAPPQSAPEPSSAEPAIAPAEASAEPVVTAPPASPLAPAHAPAKPRPTVTSRPAAQKPSAAAAPPAPSNDPILDRK